jgi:leucyl-tRNA synthetase
MKRYNPKEVEPKWQKIWDETGVYAADLNSSKPKYIAMSMFNYPSGAGIHIGHAMNYTISDVKARFKRQQGYESYHPVGWDAFGLPAENYAIKAGVSPQESMATIIPSYHKQYKAMGWSNDWEKEIATHLPEYYKWTQWIFTQMYKHGLAYQDSRMQWWCTKCQTVLANEQVIDGKCWRHDAPDDPLVEKKEVKQWFFKITDYADELLEAIDDLDWTESVKLAQKNWIGKSKGAEVEFAIVGTDKKVTVFTTRPDTLYGATFMVLAPEHELVGSITTSEQKPAIEEYARVAQQKSELERQTSKEKTGVFTGAYATNPVNGQEIPIWIADYVLEGYGTGAIMAVPAHDERDNEFARKFNLPITQVVMHFVTYDEGPNKVRDGVDWIERETVDAIIIAPDGKYLLETDNDGTHFVGGGTDGEDDEHALRREILEEVGFDDIQDIKQVASICGAAAYRSTKGKNQRTFGRFYEVKLASLRQKKSEIDEGRHTIEWIAKEGVASRIDWRGHAFAWQQYLEDSHCYHDEGVMINSNEFDGQSSSDARENIVKTLAEQGKAVEKTNYKLRDWSVSRQRYWGAPIPIIYCEKDGIVLVPDEQLPVVLPELTDFAPSGDGRSALARAEGWLSTTCPTCGGPGRRETDTLDTYICSSWYFLRYLDPTNESEPFQSSIANAWMPVDFYNGGDHATAHMIYARFVTRFFHKLGLLENPEPFKKFLFNGKVTAGDGTMFSKSKGNGIDPLEIIDSGYGADALRTYLMFAAPLELWMRWDAQGVPGTHRFLNRIWNIVQEFLESDTEDSTEEQATVLRAIHRAIHKVTADIEGQKYNTAIAAMMETTNTLYELKAKEGFVNRADWQFALDGMVALVAPFAPHIADELWRQLGHQTSVHRDSWPIYDEVYLADDTITIAVQINGKLRATLEVSADASENDVTSAAKTDSKVASHLEGYELVKTIYVPKKLVNFVIK